MQAGVRQTTGALIPSLVIVIVILLVLVIVATLARYPNGEIDQRLVDEPAAMRGAGDYDYDYDYEDEDD